jgi:predicted ATPase/transcriptional regulator with XRE-family HTH domain/Tfp pilus assembly protein PilF
MRAGWSQEDLSERTGLSLATIGALEQGRRHPHGSTVMMLADALRLDTSERASLLELASGPPALRGRLASSPEVARSGEPRRLVAPTRLIGRETDVRELTLLLDPTPSSPRLVSLVGPGGVGKTSLALAVGAELTDAYDDGAVFVDLAPVMDPGLIPATIARVLGLREIGRKPAQDELFDYLHGRQTLLVLDNFEHLLPAAPFLATLLQECARVALLVTSRVALRVRAERRWRVQPLANPAGGATSQETVAAAPAVQLFLERVHAVAPEVALDSSNARTIAAICRRLDGLPLAIELGAARIPLLGPDGLLRRLRDPLPVLGRGAADLPERQQTLQNTLRWSHELLDPAARLLLRRLAVFAGGWTLSAAEAVCAGPDLPEDAVLNSLRVLVDSSLVHRVHDLAGGVRFGMLETIREFAREQLDLNGEMDHLRASHAAFYSSLAEPVAAARTIAPWTRAELTDEAITSLEPEIDNLQLALDWWLTTRRPAEGLRLALAFHAMWSRLGQYALGRRWLQSMLDLADSLAPYLAFGMERAVALTEAGTLAGYQGDDEQARALHRRSVEAWRELDHPAGLAVALANLGLAEWVAGDATEGRALLEEALDRSRSADVPHTVAISLRNLGLIERSQGHYSQAAEWFRQAANVSLPEGWFRAYSVARSLSCLGRVAYLQHDLPGARLLFRESLETMRQAGVTGQALADSLDWQAALEAQHGQSVRAVRLFGAADQQWRAAGAHRYAPDQPAYERDLTSAQQALDDQVCAAEWAIGAALSAAQATALALGEDLDSVEPPVM